MPLLLSLLLSSYKPIFHTQLRIGQVSPSEAWKLRILPG